MRRSVFSAAVAAVTLMLVAAASAAACDGVDAEPSSTTADATRTAVLCLVNQERHNRGRATLRTSAALRGAATRFAQAMVAERFFDHVSPGGSTLALRVRRSGYLLDAHEWLAGENIGYGGGMSGTPREMVDAWMRSDGHRKNILDARFDHVGIGVAFGTPDGDPGATFVTDFGHRSR